MKHTALTDAALTEALDTLGYRLIAGADDGAQAVTRLEAVKNWADAQLAGIEGTRRLFDDAPLFLADSIGGYSFPVAS